MQNGLLKIGIAVLIGVNFSFGFSLINFNTSSAVNSISSIAKKSGDRKIKDLINKKSISNLLGIKVTDLINANLINIPGFLGVGFKCGLQNTKVPVFNICKLFKGASSKFKIKFLGVCQLQVGLSDSCVTELAKKMCSANSKKAVSPLKTMNAAAKNLTTTGNLYIKKHAWNEKCANLIASEKNKIIKNPNGVSLALIRSYYFTPQVVYKNALPSTGATNIFDPRIKDWENCIFLNAKKNSYEAALKACSDIKDEHMPLTEVDVENDIENAIPFLMNKTDDLTDNSYKNIYIYKALYLQQCSNSPNPAKCEDELWNNGFITPTGEINPKEIYQKQLSATENANARFASIVSEATAKQKEVVFKSQSFINTLPPIEQKKYEFLAKKAMYQEILNKYFLKKITDLEEEAISINYDAQKVASTPFYPQQALKEINKLIASFSAPSSSSKLGSITKGLGLSMPKISIPGI